MYTIIFFIISSILFIPCFVYGEEITLNHALELFYKNNYDIIINRYEIDKAYGDYVASRIVPNPSLSVNYTGLKPGLSRGENTQIIYRLDQLIELGGKRGLRIQSANEMLEATRLAHKDTVRTLLIGFYTHFYNVLLNELNRDMAKEELARFDRVLSIGKMRHSAGFLSLIDYTKLKIARIDIENTLASLEAQYKNEIAAFNLLISTDSVYRPSKKEVREDFPSYGENELLEVAYNNRFDLLSLQRQHKASEYALMLAKRQRVPDITVGGEYGGYGPQMNTGYGAGIAVNIPLFYQNQGEILKRTAENSQIKIQIERVKRQIQLDITQALNNYRTAIKIFDSYRVQRDEMEELLKNSEKAFSLGGINVLELLDTHKTYREFTTKYHQAMIQAAIHRDLIKVYTGEIR
ncbi:MAG: TolC family protein [Syntrophorhabdaceae bacterium]|nr:TolC family protein [Syntrophorhabdaceae bacterium]